MVPEILLGLVVDALEATPIVLPAAGIASFQALVPELELSSRIESIRVAPLALTGTQRAALWSMWSMPYQLSVEYRVHVQTS